MDERRRSANVTLFNLSLFINATRKNTFFSMCLQTLAAASVPAVYVFAPLWCLASFMLGVCCANINAGEYDDGGYRPVRGYGAIIAPRDTFYTVPRGRRVYFSP